ncbi:uncharacterized protein K452DRAFT_283203 [Aplosporella prunicola CBS 121167]|uniref:Lactam utilization protein lamB n=1 Tax=Aplosporella prunicola CBS 121167 TaxID=1176127 RepID=A0A6A6BP43_9PEZI|nr:uncharacterized protein K452DRAFT_283203 [Aplosporella prunicola CBS 121167]KAF2145909.1 hypothetical protein K452DRAFT_283203 [Aplosporella prunicola CBS 121167]
MPPSTHPIRINVDLGESYGNWACGPPTAELLPYIDHANIACGFHAGDPLIMQDTVRACLDSPSKRGPIALGAHPGLPDLQGFGRRYMALSPAELTAMTRYQIGALQGFISAEEGAPSLHHIKPHGTLYGLTSRDAEACRAVYAAVPAGARVFGLAGTAHEAVARELGIPFVAELYADVRWGRDGSLVIERRKGSWEPHETRQHVGAQVREGAVTAVTGERVEIPLGEHEVSLCVHSDSPGCMEILKAAREIVDEFNGAKFG